MYQLFKRPINFVFAILMLGVLPACRYFYGSCYGNDLNEAREETWWYAENAINFFVDTLSGSNNYAIVEGEDIIFQYYHANEDCKSVVDDEFAEVVYFQLPDSITSFSYCDSALLNIYCIYDVQAFFGMNPYYNVTQGCISGEKIDSDTWKVHIDITVNIPLDASGVKTVTSDNLYDLSGDY